MRNQVVSKALTRPGPPVSGGRPHGGTAGPGRAAGVLPTTTRHGQDCSRASTWRDPALPAPILRRPANGRLPRGFAAPRSRRHCSTFAESTLAHTLRWRSSTDPAMARIARIPKLPREVATTCARRKYAARLRGHHRLQDPSRQPPTLRSSVSSRTYGHTGASHSKVLTSTVRIGYEGRRKVRRSVLFATRQSVSSRHLSLTDADGRRRVSHLVTL